MFYTFKKESQMPRQVDGIGEIIVHLFIHFFLTYSTNIIKL